MRRGQGTCPSAIQANTNPTQTTLGLNLRLHSSFKFQSIMATRNASIFYIQMSVFNKVTLPPKTMYVTLKMSIAV
jgi:hypothetical protein